MKKILFIFSLALFMFLVVGVASAATTIGTAISTGSTLTATGAIFGNGGLDRSTAAALAIGATNATAINITPATNITGALTVGTDATGVDLLLYTDTAGEELLWDASENMLTIDGANGANALQVTDGNVAFTDNLTVTGNTTVTGILTVVDATHLAHLDYGGGVTAVESALSTYTVTAAQFDVEDTIDFTPTNQDITLTMPATSTVTVFLSAVQDKGTFWLKNATTTAGIQITISEGAGWNFKVSSTSATVFLNPLDVAKFDCRRLATGGSTAGNLDCLVTTFDER